MADKAEKMVFSTRQIIQAAALTFGTILIVGGASGMLNLGWSDTITVPVGAVIGVAASFLLIGRMEKK